MAIPQGPIVVNVHATNLRARGIPNFAAWSADPHHVYIGRNMSFFVPGTVASKWANPYTLCPGRLRVEVLAMYEHHIRTNTELWNALPELAQATELGCWCRINPNGEPQADGSDACHGDILVRLLAEHR